MWGGGGGEWGSNKKTVCGMGMDIHSGIKILQCKHPFCFHPSGLLTGLENIIVLCGFQIIISSISIGFIFTFAKDY